MREIWQEFIIICIIYLFVLICINYYWYNLSQFSDIYWSQQNYAHHFVS